MPAYYIPIEVIILRLFLAAALAFCMGLDRELKGKPYGLRPFMMLSVGSAAFTMMVIELSHHSEAIARNVEMDPGQVIQAIIGSIGFLGAAAIIRSDKHVVGATTGTGIWVVGAIGVACGLGYYWYAILLTVFALLILVVLGKLHDHIQKRQQPKP